MSQSTSQILQTCASTLDPRDQNPGSSLGISYGNKRHLACLTTSEGTSFWKSKGLVSGVKPKTCLKHRVLGVKLPFLLWWQEQLTWSPGAFVLLEMSLLSSCRLVLKVRVHREKLRGFRLFQRRKELPFWPQDNSNKKNNAQFHSGSVWPSFAASFLKGHEGVDILKVVTAIWPCAMRPFPVSLSTFMPRRAAWWNRVVMADTVLFCAPGTPPQKKLHYLPTDPRRLPCRPSGDPNCTEMWGGLCSAYFFSDVMTRLKWISFCPQWLPDPLWCRFPGIMSSMFNGWLGWGNQWWTRPPGPFQKQLLHLFQQILQKKAHCLLHSCGGFCRVQKGTGSQVLGSWNKEARAHSGLYKVREVAVAAVAHCIVRAHSALTLSVLLGMRLG